MHNGDQRAHAGKHNSSVRRMQASKAGMNKQQDQLIDQPLNKLLLKFCNNSRLKLPALRTNVVLASDHAAV
ncbi:hypothetical protein SE18_16400 [Herpetosiphon geysericola]|uniref:Uncharacterized protein n=1 Tax=Herpetosiphon geysericola TaxID=70996 RepID=A0A0P6XRN1_9CHLR|nr:hypothetical protein SE18_16400 [Herpetosiphon geysericola]